MRKTVEELVELSKKVEELIATAAVTAAVSTFIRPEGVGTVVLVLVDMLDVDTMCELRDLLEEQLDGDYLIIPTALNQICIDLKED